MTGKQKNEIASVKSALKGLATVRWSDEWDTNGEYRVNLIGGKEATAYYTSDAQDAIDTGRRMYRGPNFIDPKDPRGKVRN